MLSQNLKDWLAEFGLKQSEFAKLLGVSSRAVSMWAAGDVALPGPVAGYLRVLGQLSSEQRKCEFDRLPGRDNVFEEGVYRFRYTAHAFGETDSGQAICVLRNSKLFGCDPWGGVIRGSYEFHAARGKTVVDVDIVVPSGSRLGADTGAEQEDGTVNIVGAFVRAAPVSRAVIKVGGVPVEVSLTYLGPLPE